MGRIFVRDQDVHQAAARCADVGEGFLDAPAYLDRERDHLYLPEIQPYDPLVEFQRNHLAFEGDVSAPGHLEGFADVGIAQETVAHRGVRHDHRCMYEVCARSEIVSQTAGYVRTSIEWQPRSVAAEKTLRGQF